MNVLSNKILLNTDIKTCWKFFSDPGNLKLITPGKIFDEFVISDKREMYPGMILSYKINPFGFFKINWVTEITQVDKYKYFIDEQRFGPYKFWHHKHFFEVKENGVEVIDIVHYSLYFEKLLPFIKSLIVDKELKKIFEYRKQKLEEIFGVVCG